MSKKEFNTLVYETPAEVLITKKEEEARAQLEADYKAQLEEVKAQLEADYKEKLEKAKEELTTKNKETRSKRLQALITPKTWNALKAAADSRETSVNEVINNALETYLTAKDPDGEEE